MELYQRITLVFNPNAKELKNKLAVTLSAMTDVFERFERMDNLLRQELIRVVEEKIRKEEEIKANKKRQTRKKVDKRIVPIDKLPILIEFAK